MADVTRQQRIAEQFGQVAFKLDELAHAFRGLAEIVGAQSPQQPVREASPDARHEHVAPSAPAPASGRPVATEKSVEICQNPPKPPPAPPKEQPLVANNGKPIVWTEARRDLLRKHWPAGVSVFDLLNACQALPGAPIKSATFVGVEAAALKLRRPPGFDHRHAARLDSPQAAPTPPAPVAQAAPAAPPPQRAPQPAQPAQRVTFAHEAPPVRMAAAKTPLPVHAPAPKPIARPTAPPATELPLRTPEREQRVRDGVARGETLGQLISAVNCRPGAKMTTAELQAWIAELKPVTPPKAPASGDLRTEARRRVLEAAFKVGDAYEHIATKLNALPGAHIDAKSVEAWVRELRLTRITETPIGLLRTDFNTAMRWAIREGLQFPAGAEDKTIQKIINAEREERGERLWQITEPNRPRIGIPGHAILRERISA